MSSLYVGTSGWSYNEWVGAFYPSTTTNKLSFYSKVFNTVEVDSTFYAFPSAGVVKGWARHTPPDFVFSAKLPRAITHDKRLELGEGVESDLVRFLGLMKPLIVSGKLGAVLIQLPPSFTEKKDFERLEAFLNILPEDIQFAVEFRHPSWIKERVWSLLREHRVANTIVDEPLLPPDTIVTSDVAFIRWHGRGNRPWYNYRYDETELSSWAPRVASVMKTSKKVFGYFNNHFHGYAVENSLKILGILGFASQRQREVEKSATSHIESALSGGGSRTEGSMLEFISGREG